MNDHRIPPDEAASAFLDGELGAEEAETVRRHPRLAPRGAADAAVEAALADFDARRGSAAELAQRRPRGLSVITGVAAAVAIGFIVVMLAMYTAILERTREIGILKAIGASKAVIGSIVMRETLVVSAIGIVVGYGLSVVGTELVAIRYPLIPIIFIPEWLAGAAALTIIGSIAGASYPAWKAAKADPCDVLSYE